MQIVHNLYPINIIAEFCSFVNLSSDADHRSQN